MVATITVNVTAEHIAVGGHQTDNCPVSLALREAFGLPWFVTPQRAEVGAPGEGEVWCCSAKTTSWIRWWDEGGVGEPFTAAVERVR